MATVEEEIFEEIVRSSNETIFEKETIGFSDQFINLYLAMTVTINLLGAAVHLLILAVIVTSKRLRSRSILVIGHWLVCDMIALKLLPTIFALVHLHRINFTIHIILFNFVILFVLYKLLFLNVLINDTIMITNKYSFKKFMDRTRVVMLVTSASIIFWKFLRTDAILELIMTLIMMALSLSLVCTLALKQICRLISKCRNMCGGGERKTTDSITELRLHLPTFYVCGQLLTYCLTVAAHVIYKSPWLSVMALFWNLNGLYVLALLLVKDTNFRVTFRDFVCFKRGAESDSETQGMISDNCDRDIDAAEAASSKQDTN